MAQKVHIEMVDDLDGSEAAETITFGLDGINYEMDLSEKNAAKLRKVLGDFIGNARRTSKNGAPQKRTPSGPSAREIRDWARSAGLDVPDRGRVPEAVTAAYAAAH